MRGIDNIYTERQSRNGKLTQPRITETLPEGIIIEEQQAAMSGGNFRTTD